MVIELFLDLIQHDQVKVEVLQQDMIPVLIRSVVEKQPYHSIKTQQCAIEILLTLSFNKEALNILQKDADLIKCLATLKISNEEAIQRAASHLIWELAQKHDISNTSLEQPVSKWKFNMMISYSHDDKKLCFQICDLLEKDGFHIWLDRDRMHGDAIVAMADAIENSEFVIICMSESYRSSPYCQAEANYAFQRRCKLLPLVMKARYKPDGWLGFITSGKIYVDFTKYQLNQAYSLLKNEIAQKREMITNKPKEVEVSHQPVTPFMSPLKIYRRPIKMYVYTFTKKMAFKRIYPLFLLRSRDLPLSVHDWSEEHVRCFLDTNNFTSLYTVFENFNGHLLYRSYLMCDKNPEPMFQAMRQEVGASSNSSILTLGTYLRFLEQLKRYIPTDTNKTSQSLATTTTCTII